MAEGITRVTTQQDFSWKSPKWPDNAKDGHLFVSAKRIEQQHKNTSVVPVMNKPVVKRKASRELITNWLPIAIGARPFEVKSTLSSVDVKIQVHDLPAAVSITDVNSTRPIEQFLLQLQFMSGENLCQSIQIAFEWISRLVLVGIRWPHVTLTSTEVQVRTDVNLHRQLQSRYINRMFRGAHMTEFADLATTNTSWVWEHWED